MSGLFIRPCRVNRNYTSRFHIQWHQLKILREMFFEAKVPNSVGIAHYKNGATPLRTKDINTKHQHFQMRYITLNRLKPSKVIS